MRIQAYAVLAALIVSVCLVLSPAGARAGQETDFVITVRAQDAKFIGPTAGGAQIVVRDRRTGDILASGTAYGETGDTALLMADSIKRGQVLRTPGVASFSFSLEFWEPLPVTISATAPLAMPQNAVTVSEDMLLLPGKDYTAGNGIMLELPGFGVDVARPAPGTEIVLDPAKPIPVEASVMKLCGCRIAAGSPWPPERYEVEARVYKDNLFIAAVAMTYADEPGLYRAGLKVPQVGTYRIAVTAFDAQTKEAGMDMTTVTVKDPATHE